MKARLTVYIFLFIAASYLAPLRANAQAAPEKSKIICDHAAPPRGMHYVCKSQCDCHLEGQLRNEDDGSPIPSDNDSHRVCQYQPPQQGNLLVCDSACKCQVFGPKEPQKVESKEAAKGACQQLIRSIVAPVYPPIARTNRIAGAVFVQIEIGDDGFVKTARAIEGHPMLTQAALEAVKRWSFNTTCNRVRMVDVRFRLSTNEETDPPGVIINPPDEVEVVAGTIQVDTTSTALAKSKRKKKAAKAPVTSK